jgi:hypothetical protein
VVPLLNVTTSAIRRCGRPAEDTAWSVQPDHRGNGRSTRSLARSRRSTSRRPVGSPHRRSLPTGVKRGRVSGSGTQDLLPDFSEVPGLAVPSEVPSPGRTLPAHDEDVRPRSMTPGSTVGSPLERSTPPSPADWAPVSAYPEIPRAPDPPSAVKATSTCEAECAGQGFFKAPLCIPDAGSSPRNRPSEQRTMLPSVAESLLGAGSLIPGCVNRRNRRLRLPRHRPDL